MKSVCLKTRILPLRQGVKLTTKKNWFVTSFSNMANTFVIFYSCNPQSSKRNVQLRNISVWFGYHTEYLSFDSTLAKINFWVSNLMTSQNIIFPSKVTVSERILVGRQPFFHRYGEKEIFCFFSRKSYSRPQYQTRS